MIRRRRAPEEPSPWEHLASVVCADCGADLGRMAPGTPEEHRASAALVGERHRMLGCPGPAGCSCGHGSPAHFAAGGACVSCECDTFRQGEAQ